DGHLADESDSPPQPPLKNLCLRNIRAGQPEFRLLSKANDSPVREWPPRKSRQTLISRPHSVRRRKLLELQAEYVVETEELRQFASDIAIGAAPCIEICFLQEDQVRLVFP